MSIFALLNWFCSICSTLILLKIAIRQKHLLLKPTVVVLAFFNAKIQWSGAMNSEWIESELADPWDFLLLAQIFPLAALLITGLTFQRSSYEVFNRIKAVADEEFANLPKRILHQLLIMIGLITIWYLYVVPLHQTGLYAIIFDPFSSDEARERSLSAAGGTYFPYFVNIMLAVLYPVFATLYVYRTYARRTSNGWFSMGIVMSALLAVLVAVTITGERSRSVLLLLTLGFAHFLRKGGSIRPVQLTAAVTAVLLIPAILTVLRQGESLSLENLWSFYPYIFDRAVCGPMKTGVFYASYVQSSGLFGIAGIPKLAMLADVKPIDVPNFMGLLHEGTAIESVGMNTSYVFFYYSCFGLYAFIPSFLMLLMLDFALWVYVRLKGPILIACVATTSLILTKLTDTNYTTVIATHGFFVTLILCEMLARFQRRSSFMQNGIGSPRLTSLRARPALTLRAGVKL